MLKAITIALSVCLCHALSPYSNIRRHSQFNFPVQGSTNIVELGLWLGPDLREYLMDITGSSGSEFETYVNRYATAIARDVDVVLRNMTSIDFRLYVSWVATTSSPQDWYTNNLNSRKLNGASALSDFSTFIAGQTSAQLLAPVDHIIALTRANVEDSAGVNPKTLSVTEVNSMCTGLSSNSISEVATRFYMKAMAQAILQAAGVTKAIGSNLFIMSEDVATIPDASNADQPWRVKGNKQTQLVNYINALGSNCLLTEDASYDYINNFAPIKPIGVEFTISEQCILAYFNTSTPCSLVDQTICYSGIQCTNDAGTCNTLLYVGDRTTCDTDLSCRYGTCSYTGEFTSTTSSTMASTSPMMSSSTLEASSTIDPQVSSTTDEEPTCKEQPVGRILIDLTYIPCPDRV